MDANSLDRLGTAIILSLAVHNILFLSFSAGIKPGSDGYFHKTETALEVALIHPNQAPQKPLRPDIRAQISSDGGGAHTEPVHAKSPPASIQSKIPAPAAVAPLQTRARALEQEAQRLLTQAQSMHAVNQPKPPLSRVPEPPSPQPAAMDSPQSPGLVARSLANARALGRIEEDFADYQRQPRRVFIGARAEEYAFARYLEEWRMKVERVGNLNYPEAARRQRLYGHLLITVEINADGSLRKAVIEHSSGSAILDEAAVQIVRMAAPFAVFSAAMRQKADIVSISKTVTFTRSDQLSAE